MLSPRLILKGLSSAIKLKKKKIKCVFPVYVSRNSRVIAHEHVLIGKQVSISVGELILGEGVSISSKCKLIGRSIRIGRRTNMNARCYANVGDSALEIGNFCAIASQVTIWGIDHNYNLPGIQVKFFHDLLGEQYSFVNKGPIRIGSDVQIGHRAIVLPGVSIGDGSIIGAGSVVTKDIPAYSIAVGAPARIIKSRFNQEVIDFLEKTRWWDWDLVKIERNRAFFKLNLNEVVNPREIADLIV